MTRHYSLHKQAEDDLELIWSYSYQTWGLEQADKYLNLLLSRIQWLSENPLTGKNRNDIKPGYYCFPQGMHLIFYKIVSDGIDILGIPHQSMDVSTHLDKHTNEPLIHFT